MPTANLDLFLEICKVSSPVLHLNSRPLGWKANAPTTELKCDHTLASHQYFTWRCDNIGVVIPAFTHWLPGSLLAKSTQWYAQVFKPCRYVNVCHVCPRKARNNWFETDSNINNLCDNKNVKFHCFNSYKTQPLEASVGWSCQLETVYMCNEKIVQDLLTFCSHRFFSQQAAKKKKEKKVEDYDSDASDISDSEFDNYLGRNRVTLLCQVFFTIPCWLIAAVQVKRRP